MNSRTTARVLLSVGLTALSSVSVYAQQNTLKDAAQKAVLSNPEVLQRWHAYQAAINEKDVAFGGYLPRLDLAAGVSREHRDDPIIADSSYTSRSTTLTLTQMLYDGFATHNEVKRLDHARKVRLFELFDASETAALEASRAYLDVLRYRKLVGLAEENYVRHKAVFEQLQKKAQAGVARRVDLEQASGRLALAEANLLTESANLHDVSARYQRLVGDIPGQELAEAPAMDKGLPGDANVVLKAAEERSPAIRAAVENVRAADAAHDGRKAAYQPRVDLKLSEERGSDLNGYLGSTRNRSAGVVLNWNLFNGLSDRARSRQYADLLNVAKDQRDQACRDVRQTTAIAYDDVRKLTEQLKYLDQHQLATEKARDAYRKQFDIGQRSLLDLLDTENELFQSRRAYVNGEYDLLIAQARTQAGLGNLLGTLGLARVDQENQPDMADWEAGEDAPQVCPPMAPLLYAADKAALDARAEQMMRESVLTAAPPTESAPQPAPVAETPPQPAPVASSGTEREVFDVLDAWKAAWTSANVKNYLGFYAANFKPTRSDQPDHTAWLGDRKRIIGGARNIRLNVEDVKVTVKDATHATTTFRQHYQSASYEDRVSKTIDWEKIDGKWLIVRELAVPELP